MRQAGDPGANQLAEKGAADRDDARQWPGAEIDQREIDEKQGAQCGNLEITGVR